MNDPAIALLLALLFTATARAAEPAVEPFVIDDTTYGLQRPVWLYRSPGTARG